jgi:transposase
VDLTAQLLNPTKPFQTHLCSDTSVRSVDDDDTIAPHQLNGTRPRLKQAQHRLKAEQVRELVAAYVAGASVHQLTKQFQVHRSTVVAHLERHGIPRRASTRKLSDDDVPQAAKLYEQGWSLVRLGEHYSVDDETVRRALQRLGVKLRPRRGWT